MDELKRRILVVGSTGVGKSSLIKYLLKSNNNKEYNNITISSSASGCTFEYAEYNYNKFILIDTVGLNETDNGTISGVDAFNKLCNFIYKNKEGFSLILFIIKKGRITNESKSTFDIFVNKIIDGRVPVILTITGCENEEPMNAWLNNSNTHTLAVNGFKYKDALCCSFAETTNKKLDIIYDEYRNQSIKELNSLINKYNIEPQKLFDSTTGFVWLIKKTWNSLCDNIKFNNFKFGLNEKLINMLIQMGMLRKDAENILIEYGFF